MQSRMKRIKACLMGRVNRHKAIHMIKEKVEMGAVDRAKNALRQLVSNGDLVPGRRLIEPDLVAQLRSQQVALDGLDARKQVRPLLHFPQIQRLLHPQPALRRRVEQLADAGCHLGRHAAFFVQQFRDRQPTDAQPLRKLRLRHFQRRQHVFTQYGARVCGGL